MQERRVVITVRYTQDSGLKPYFLTVAKKIKSSHPDVIIERKVLPKDKKNDDDGESAIFEVCVDTKVVVGRRYNNRRSTRSLGRVDMSSTSSRRNTIFVNMQELDVAISRARRKRRPNTTYGENSPTTGGTLIGTMNTSRRTLNTNKSTNQQRKQHQS